MALFWVLRESEGACGWSVVQLDFDGEWGLVRDVWLYGCRTGGPAHHQEGGADGFPLSSLKSDWTHLGTRRRQRNHIWATERTKEMHRSRSW